MDPLIVALRGPRWRMTIQQGLGFATVALIASISACCVWLLATRLFPLLPWSNTFALTFVGLEVAAALAWSVYRRPALITAALETDRRLGLRERLTSSLQLADAEGPMVQALHADARAQLASVDAKDAFPFHMPRSARWISVPLVAFGMAYVFLPEFDLFGFRERRVEAKVQEKARRVRAEQLAAVARPLRERLPGAAPDGLAEAALAIERVAEELSSGGLNEKQAVAKLGDLGEELFKRREALQPELPMRDLAAKLGQLAPARDLAKDMANGDFGEAAKKARELQQKLKEGELGEEEKRKLAEDMKVLSKMLGENEGAQSTALSEALAKAAAQSMEGMPEGLDAMAMSLEDMASALEQLEKIDAAMLKLAKCPEAMFGKKYKCLSELSCNGCGYFGRGGGRWRPGTSNRFGPGMGGPGHGRGGSTGLLPDLDEEFEPAMLPGEVSKGKFLANIVQRTAPDQEGAQPTAEFVTGVFAEAKQEAEQALTKEEIPPASREFVRQYFGSLEPEEGPAEQDRLQNGNHTNTR